MRALRYHGPKKPLRLEEVPAPSPGPGEVVVKVTAAGVCHTDLHFLSGLLDLGVAPLTLGHEIVGRIESVGAGVPPSRISASTFARTPTRSRWRTTSRAFAGVRRATFTQLVTWPVRTKRSTIRTV